MTYDERLAQSLADWIRTGPDTAPDHVIRAAVLEARGVPQVSRWHVGQTVPHPAPFAMLVMLLVTLTTLAGVLATWDLRPTSGGAATPAAVGTWAADVALPEPISSASDWEPGSGLLEGRLELADRYDSVDALAEDVFSANAGLDLPFESCGYDGPVYTVEADDTVAYYGVTLVHADGPTGGFQTVLVLSRDSSGWSVVESWSRTLSSEGVEPTVCDTWNPQATGWEPSSRPGAAAAQ